MLTKRNLLLGTAAAAVLAFGSAANAAQILNAVSVVIDGSGSISTTEFAIQRTAYATLFNDATVLPADGSVVVNVIQFSSQGTGIIEQTALRINDDTDRETLVAAVNAMVRLNGSTDIQEGIDLGVTNMDAFLVTIDMSEFDTGFEKLVDVSTDGNHNEPGDPAAEAQNAVNVLGYSAVNCLGIGASANCSFNDGVGTDFAATTFDDVEAVLRLKLQQEFDTIPAAATIWLLGAGLLGLGVVSRRKA